MYILENRYDRLYKEPETELGKVTITEEYIAQKIIRLGLLKIADDVSCNFVNLPLLNGKKIFSFSSRQIFDKDLYSETYKIISENLTFEEKKNASLAINSKINYIKAELKKYHPIPEDVELKLGRLIAQSSHPAIMLNIIRQKVNIFVSFSHNISDLLNVHNWQQSRGNSGMQSYSGESSSIFISCAGNPFLDPDETGYANDGFFAVARLMIVAAQEIGHYADIIKTSNYPQRFSIDLKYNKANEKCDFFRKNDIAITLNIMRKFEKSGLFKLAELEKRLEVQSKYRKYSLAVLFIKLSLSVFKIKFLFSCRLNGLMNIVGNIKSSKQLGLEVIECISDFRYNLSPKADVYLSENKIWENAISCAEALARVPQQKIKWGSKITSSFMPKLYNYFYNEVIDSEIKFFELTSGKKFFIDKRLPYIPVYRKVLNTLKKLSQ